VLDGLLHPAWTWHWLTGEPLEPANVARAAAEAVGEGGSLLQFVDRQFDPSVTWDDAQWMMEQWGGSFVIKGILSPDDARRAVEVGADAIVVSNHGGRQLDHTPATLEVLPEIVNAVDGRAEVYLDSGVRRGTDVIKALALGARACLIGRPYLYALAADGEAGVSRLMEIFRDEIRRSLALLGCPSVQELSRDYLRPAVPPLSTDR
jgi:L-lactate dehydrogenase (cytochrome)